MRDEIRHVDRDSDRAKRLVVASFADHGEKKPDRPDACPVTLAELIDADLDVERLITALAKR